MDRGRYCSFDEFFYLYIIYIGYIFGLGFRVIFSGFGI